MATKPVMRKRKDGQKTWDFQIYIDGKLKMKSWRQPPEMPANEVKRVLTKYIIDFETEEREKVRQLKQSQLETETRSREEMDNMTVSQYCTRYLNFIKNSDKALSTIIKKEKGIELLNRFIGSIRMKDLNSFHFEPILNHVQNYRIIKETGKLKQSLDNVLKDKLEREIYERAGVADTTFYFAKNGRTMEWKTIEKICKALQINPHDYFNKIIDKQPYKNETKLSIKRVILAIFNHAVAYRVMPYNPAQIVFRDIKKVRIKKQVLQPEQLKEFYNAILKEKDIRIKTCIALLIFTGMRKGEVCGLEWKHIDFEKGIIRIKQSATHLKGEYITKAPKTEYGIREIEASELLLSILRKCKEWYDGESERLAGWWQDSDRVLVRNNGQPISPNTPAGWLNKIIAKNNLPHAYCHLFRHTNISLQLNEAGLSAREVADNVGHADPHITLDVYSHSLDTSKRKSAQFFDKFFTNDYIMQFPKVQSE